MDYKPLMGVKTRLTEIGSAPEISVFTTSSRKMDSPRPSRDRPSKPPAVFDPIPEVDQVLHIPSWVC